jgi:hypothetical protein
VANSKLVLPLPLVAQPAALPVLTGLESEPSSGSASTTSECPETIPGNSPGISTPSKTAGAGAGRGRYSRGAVKKQQDAALKADHEKRIKIYKLKYEKYLVLKPLTNSPFDALINASQVCVHF